LRGIRCRATTEALTEVVARAQARALLFVPQSKSVAMTNQQIELQRFLMRLASEIAYRREVMPFEIDVLRILARYIEHQYPEAATSAALLYLRLALDTADAQLHQEQRNSYSAIDVALKIACVVGVLQEMSSSTTVEEQK
jgi:hypothetical protein